MLRVEGLRKSYGHIEAVRGIDFHIRRGEVVGLLGPNGAGKTSILRILTAYHFPSAGAARIQSHYVSEEPVEAKRLIGYLAENSPVYNELNVREFLEFIAAQHDIPRTRRRQAIADAAAECGIEDVLQRDIRTLSKGYRQRVGLAGAIIHSPELLILDEPTNGLDPNQIREIRNLILRLGKSKTVILSTHILQEVEAVCSRVLILNEGRIIAEGTTESIRRRVEGVSLYHIRLRNSRKELEAALSRETACIEAGEIREGEEETSCEIELTRDTDGERIYRWAVENELRLIELREKRASLEELFARLTAGGEDAAEESE